MKLLKSILYSHWDGYRIFKIALGIFIMLIPLFDDIENSIILLGGIIFMQGLFNFNCCPCSAGSCKYPSKQK